ncbi:capsular polysaccharide biosynthesis protein [Zobellella maritima]|uniref:capsular polysaccharide biosynthesis protein n=1 Tax=Zobellella maritima TaxID=2059725 RepID=UPI000E30A8E7|nr:capsular polysaccharide biosynthesis protein [Zobellella maritima]
MLLTTSPGIWRQRRILNGLLAPQTLTTRPYGALNAVVGWGMKPNTERARKWATRRALPFWQLEDGFIGYIGHPATGAVRLSLIVDDVGMYYDATRPSRLERMIDDNSWWNPAWQQRAEQLQTLLISGGITKYNCYGDNHLTPAIAARLDATRPRVLLIDQTRGDLAVHLGLAGEHSFIDMLKAARLENPGAQLIVRTHPDVLLGKKRGYLVDIADDDVLLLADTVNPFALLTTVDKVYTVSSQLGFEALLAGKPVVCFGAPFYAGWGVTDDRVVIPRRGKTRTVSQILAAAYVRYCRYADPITGQRCVPEDLLDLILAQRPPTARLKKLHVIGFSLWRRRFAPHFLRRYADEIVFSQELKTGKSHLQADSSKPEDNNLPSVASTLTGQAAVSIHSDRQSPAPLVRYDEAVLVWGQEPVAPQPMPVWRMEDGFLRSVGLGSDLRRPGSLVVDQLGMYYNPHSPSTLERHLATHLFSDRELALAEQLMSYLRQQALTKYNVGAQSLLNWRTRAGDKTIILVPGQVDNDASIQLGSPVVKDNAALLQAVRDTHPDAFIVFKPHPDVVNGNRKGIVSTEVLARCTDAVETETSIVTCLDACDAVHTLTSLTGLEALIRGKPVTVWGQPFYAGWGLTEDRYPVNRRGRSLPLAALVYAAYAWYPTYIDWPTGLYSTPLRMAWRLAQERETLSESGHPVKAWCQRRWRKFRFLWEALRG